MKTTTYTLTLLALTIQVMVSGQTQDNQILKIRSDIYSAKPIVPEELRRATTMTDTKEMEAILKEANDLKDEEQKLKTEVTSIQQKFIFKQIEISQLKSKLTYETFDLNKATINGLLKRRDYKPTIIQKTGALSNEAEYAVKMAKEMREEADAQFTLEARLAEMSNAEEKEALALNKQQEAITLLTRSIPLLITENNIELKNSLVFTQLNTPSNNYISDNSALTELLKQTADLKKTVGELREAAITKQGNEKMVLLSEANTMEKEYTAKQITVSLSTYKSTSKTFYDNKALIEQLIKAIDNEVLTQHAQQISDEADYTFRLAKEMREEADAQFTETARLGEMSNAEEKEEIALTKQQETFIHLKKISKNMQLASN